jgi:pectate lyase
MKLSLVPIAVAASVLIGCGGSGSSSDKSASISSTTSTSSGSSISSSSLSSSSSSQSSSSATTVTGLSCEFVNTTFGFAAIDDQDKPYDITGGADVGQGNYEVVVTTGNQLRSAVYGSASIYKDKPLTIYVAGKIDWENSGKSDIRIERSNVSIIGRGDEAMFEGVGIEIRPTNNSTAQNIVIRNLKMGLVPQANGSGDIISLNASGTNAKIRNVWIDHNELYNNLITEGCTSEDCHKDYYDELVSGRGNISNITISYNYLHDSWKTSLWGSSDSTAEDVGRRVTFHHNYWKDVNSRLPLYRYGYLHMLNNYYHNVTGSGINLRMGARGLVEGNVFERVKDPIVSLDSSALGYWTIGSGYLENQYINPIAVSGSCTGNAPPCRNAQNRSTDLTPYTPAYDYTDVTIATSEVAEFVKANAGVGVINQCL